MNRCAPPATAAVASALRELVPQAWRDGAIDLDALKAVLGDGAATSGDLDRYRFTWAGKRDAIRLLQQPGIGALRPDPGESVRFETTTHLFIEGENLEALKLLAASYAGSVRLVYIDPPYNTGNDFIYPDDYRTPLADYLRLTRQVDAGGNLLTSNPETSGRYHSAWLSMMYPRLFLARQLLRDDGAICVSIGEEELANLRLLMNEIFGEEQHRNTLVVRRFDKNLNRQFMERGLKTLNVGVEYVLVYGRSDAFVMNPVHRAAREARQSAGYWKGFWNAADRPTMRYPLLGVTPATGQWKWKREIAEDAVDHHATYLRDHAHAMTLEEHWRATGERLRFIRRNPGGVGRNQGVEHWIPPSAGILRSSNWTDLIASQPLNDDGLAFDNPKNVELMRELVRLCCDDGDLVLDFFAGSATMPHAVLDLNHDDDGSRRFIAIQLPEPCGGARDRHRTIAAIGRERLRRRIRELADERAAKGRCPIDLGFRAFTLGRSSFRCWDAPPAVGTSPETYAHHLARSVEGLIDGWRPLDVIHEVSLKEGYGLALAVEPARDLPGSGANLIHRVTSVEHDGRAFLICLDATIAPETVHALRDRLSESDLFICRDTALDDAAAANLASACRLKTL